MWGANLASYPSRFDDQVDALTTGLLWDQQRKLQEIPPLTCISVSTRDAGWGESSSFSLRNNGLSSDMNHWLHNVGDAAVGGLGSMLDDELGFDGFNDPGDEEQRD